MIFVFLTATGDTDKMCPQIRIKQPNEGLLKRRELAMIESAGRAGNLGWVLRQIGTELDRRQFYRLRLLLGCIRPAVIVVIGIVVGVIVVSLFMPLVKLIANMA